MADRKSTDFFVSLLQLRKRVIVNVSKLSLLLRTSSTAVTKNPTINQSSHLTGSNEEHWGVVDSCNPLETPWKPPGSADKNSKMTDHADNYFSQSEILVWISRVRMLSRKPMHRSLACRSFLDMLPRKKCPCTFLKMKIWFCPLEKRERIENT